LLFVIAFVKCIQNYKPQTMFLGYIMHYYTICSASGTFIAVLYYYCYLYDYY